MLLPVFITTAGRKTYLAISVMRKHEYYAVMYQKLLRHNRICR